MNTINEGIQEKKMKRAGGMYSKDADRPDQVNAIARGT